MSPLLISRNPRYPSESLRPLAVLAWSPREFSTERSIPFVSSVDDLDEYQWARLEIDGEPYFLLRYANSPEAGTEVLASPNLDPQEAIQTFLRIMELPENIVTWRTEEPKTEPALIIEPANPYDIPKEKLRNVAHRLGFVLPSGIAARIALRPEVGFGVSGFQALRVWMPDEASDDLVKKVTSAFAELLKELWDEDRAHGRTARTRSLSVFAPDGRTLRELMIRGEDGAVLNEAVRHERSLLPRPSVDDFADPD